MVTFWGVLGGPFLGLHPDPKRGPPPPCFWTISPPILPSKRPPKRPSKRPSKMTIETYYIMDSILTAGTVYYSTPYCFFFSLDCSPRYTKCSPGSVIRCSSIQGSIAWMVFLFIITDHTVCTIFHDRLRFRQTLFCIRYMLS